MTRKERDRLIRHHCEEISTHVGALRQLVPEKNTYQQELNKIGRIVKSLFLLCGGQSH